MFVVYFALWVILNGRWTVEIALFGVAFAALMTAFCCRFMGYSLEKEKRLVRGIAPALRYGALLLSEIVKANVTVIRMILTPGFEPKPQLVRFHSGLEDEAHRVALADSITLTPGTITCHLEGDEFVVHCLDESLMAGLDDGAMPAALRRMEAQMQAEKQAKEEEHEH